ncbi:hypothetical protein SEA_CASSEROLE_49 [Arthrobacter phage Casserole]|nr:hypothetical protein SEA_CASSEROLE_49 [Arthrobacter phage Casserole]
MFEEGDRVQINLGGVFGIETGTVISVENGGKLIKVSRDSGGRAELDPWDVFLIDQKED